MFYSSKWKSGFFTGLITGITIYALASNKKGRVVLGKLQGVTDIVKGQVNTMSAQANNVLDSTAQLANDLSRQESSQAVGASITPGGTYSAADAYAPGRV